MVRKNNLVSRLHSIVPFALLSAALFACHTSPSHAEPSSSARVTSGSAATPSSKIDMAKLRLVPGRAGREDTGFVQIYGEVVNETGQPIENVKVHVDLLDAQGKSLDVGGWLSTYKEEIGAQRGEVALGEIRYIPAGGSTPFHYVRDTSKIKGTYASHKLTVTAQPVSGSMPTATIDAPQAVKGDNDLVMLKGTFKVTGSEACRSPNAFFAFYDANGHVMDIVDPHKNALDGFFQKELTPGQTIAFEGKSYPRGGTGAKMKVWASCDYRDAPKAKK